ncbi:MAG: TetR/AcrR family transcriptional regulator [Clostridia bacterium]|nr:TetR/AcrR family transcriptional regulator [Clostridia bacterium]
MEAEKEIRIQDEISEQILVIAEELVKENGAGNVTVRQILKRMGVTNRVFYNRYKNMDEVLELVYFKEVEKMHESLVSDYDVRTDFFGYVMDVALKVLINTYEVKRQFSQYMFEYDSRKEANRNWWTEKIKSIIAIGKETGQLGDVDAEKLSYTVWCFFRGYNADAVQRQLSMKEAVESFRFGLECLLRGLKNA